MVYVQKTLLPSEKIDIGYSFNPMKTKHSLKCNIHCIIKCFLVETPSIKQSNESFPYLKYKNYNSLSVSYN